MEEKTNIWSALAAFQKECPQITKDSKAGSGNFTYSYSSLPAIIEAIGPVLQKHKLVIIQPLESDEIGRYVKTILNHYDSGEKIESRTEIPNVKLGSMNDFQSLGSGITYLRRYALCAILGIVSDEDNDAAGEQKPTNNSKTQSSSKTAAKWLNREVPRNSGKITEDWYKAVAYLRGETPREDGQEPKLEDLEVRFKISKQNKEDIKEDVMNDDFKLPQQEDAPPPGNEDLPF